jgi:hypothetical protein
MFLQTTQHGGIKVRKNSIKGLKKPNILWKTRQENLPSPFRAAAEAK